MLIEPAPWALRTVPEAELIEHLLMWHSPPPGGGEAALDELRATIAAALLDWRRLGLASVEAAGGGRLYDPVEVFNVSLALGVAGEDDHWARHYVPVHLDSIFSLHGSDVPCDRAPPTEDLSPRAFRLRLRRDFDLSGLAVGSRVRLRLPVPIDSHALELGSIAFTAPDGAIRRASPDRFEARFELAVPGMVSLGFDARFVAHADCGHDEDISAEDVALFTAPRENLIVVSPAVAALARRIAGGGRPGLATVLAFHDHIVETWLLGALPYHALDRHAPLDWVLEQGWFDCQIGSALLCALCRAVGIPARLEGGYQLYATNLAPHYWAQIWVDGRWLPFDFMPWHMIRAGHDPSWRRAFAGRIDYRLKTLAMPKLFTGPSSLALTPKWHNLLRPEPDGLSSIFYDARTHALLYREHLGFVAGGDG